LLADEGSANPGPDAADDGERTHKDGANVTPLPRKNGGQPLSDRVDETEGAEVVEEEDGQQAFAVEEAGKVITLAQLVRRGTPVEVRYKMTGRSLGAGKGGLIDPYQTTTLIVADCVVDDVKTTFLRDENQKVEGVIQYVTLKPRAALPALSEAGAVMLNEAAKAKAANAA